MAWLGEPTAAVRKQMEKQRYSQVFQPPLTSAASLFWEMLYWGSGISDKAKRILAVIWFFVPQGISYALRWSSGELSLPSTWCQYTFVHPQFFSDGCNQGSSLSTTSNVEKNIISEKKWVTSSTDKLWQDRGDACPKREMFTNREAGKTATPQLRVSVSHLLIYHAALGSVWTHHCYRKTLFLSSSKWADWTSSTQKRQSLFCISLSTQDCSITMFPLRWRQLELYSTASFHTLWIQQHFCCYQRYLLIRETAAVVLPRHIFKWRRTLWKESCLENSAVKAKMFDFWGLGVHISKQQFKGEGKFYVLPTCQYTTLCDSHTHHEILLRRQFFSLAAMVPSILLLA